MAIQLATDHPTILVKPRIDEICKNFLTTFGFNYFQYLRCWADGSVSLLTNNTGPMEYFCQVKNAPVIFSSFAKEHQNNYSYWFLWDEELPEFPVELARRKFGVFNGLTLVRRTRNYYDMIAVGVPAEVANPGGFYLNKFQAIEQFVNSFDHENKDLIQYINKNPITLPPAYRDVNYQEICLTTGKINVTGKTGMTYITAQELACLRGVLQGSSYKQIGNELEISARTVETYLQRIKLRTGFSARADMERMITVSTVF